MAVKALCLAGGYGTRLGDLTKNTPKPLIEVAGKPVLEHLIDNLNLHNVSQLIVNTHYLPTQVNKALQTRALYYHVPTLLGHSGTIFALKNWLEDDFFFVLNGDTLSNINYSQMLNYKRENEIVAAMDENRAVGTWLYPPKFFKDADLPIRPYRPPDLIWFDIGTPERLKEAKSYYEK